MSIKLVNGYDVPQESGLDYQGFGDGLFPPAITSYVAAKQRPTMTRAQCTEQWAQYHATIASGGGPALIIGGVNYGRSIPISPPCPDPFGRGPANTRGQYKSQYGGYGNTVDVTGHGREMVLSGLGRAALGAFYGARLPEDPLYNTMPDPAYGSFGDCGCAGRKPMGRYGSFGAEIALSAKSAPVYQTRTDYLAAQPREVGTIPWTERGRVTVEELGNDPVPDGSGIVNMVDPGAQAPPPSGPSPMLLLGIAAIGIGLFMKGK